MEIETEIPYSRIDLKELYNKLMNNKTKKQLTPTLGEIRSLLNSLGYKLVEHRYYNKYMRRYYIISPQLD